MHCTVAQSFEVVMPGGSWGVQRQPPLLLLCKLHTHALTGSQAVKKLYCVFMLLPLAPETVAIITCRCKGETITVQINVNDNFKCEIWSYKSMRAKDRLLHGNE